MKFCQKIIAASLASLALPLLLEVQPACAQTETVLHDFCYNNDCPNADGIEPQSSLTPDGKGNFFGTTFDGGIYGNSGAPGGGTVFEISPNGNGGWNEAVLYNFCAETNCTDGSGPYYSNVVFDSAGNLYGTTEQGGVYGFGVVFELSPSAGAWTETVLHSFGPDEQDLLYPINGLIIDVAGNLYGKTIYGTTGDSGIFELSPSAGGWTYRVIYGGGSDGANYAGLSMNSSGDIFGTTNVTVFELSPNGVGGWTTTIIHNFAGGSKDGSSANAAPTPDQAGNLYGTTQSGGTYDNGLVYKLTPGKNGKWTEKILYSFKGGTKDGAEPSAGVVLDAAGNIYGTTQNAGKYATCGSLGCGTVFELTAPVGTGSYKEKLLWNFNGTDGYEPVANLILDSAGDLYGTTIGGGSTYNEENGCSCGVVFEISPSGTAAKTTTTLTSSPNPSTSGENVTFTAVVTPAPPDGETISFEELTTVLGTGVLSGGSATFTTSTLSVGTTSVKAVYGGDGNFDASTSNTIKQVVNN